MKRRPASQPVAGVAMPLISNIYSRVFGCVRVALRAVPLPGIRIIAVPHPIIDVGAFGVPPKIVKAVVRPLPISMTALHTARARSRKCGQHNPMNKVAVMQVDVTVISNTPGQNSPGVRVRSPIASGNYAVNASNAAERGYFIAVWSRHPHFNTGAGCAAVLLKTRPAERPCNDAI